MASGDPAELVLGRWFRVLDHVDENPVTVTVLGDSITAGVAASGGGRGRGRWRRPSQRYASVLSRLLADRFNELKPLEAWDGTGWLEVESRTSNLRFGWDVAAGQPDPCGLAAHGWKLGPGDELFHAAHCDGVDLFYSVSPDGGPFEVSIDGLVVAEVGSRDDSVPSVQSGWCWSSDPLPLEWHEIRVRATSAFGARVDGGYFHRGTRSSGVRVHVGGHNRWNTYEVLDCEGTIDHLASAPPDLIVWSTGTNDYQFGADGHAEALRKVVHTMGKVVPDAELVFVCPFAVKRRTDWSDFRDAARDVAHESRAGFVDLHGLVGDKVVSPDTQMLSNDLAHPNTAGHRFIADAVAACIIPPAGEPPT